MNWGMIAAGIVIGFIGGAMINDGDNPLVVWLGMFVTTVVAGSLMCIGIGVPEWAGWTDLDEVQCSQYVYMDGNWQCIPWERGG